MNLPSDDWPLLNAFIATNSEDAFAALVARHIGLVYAAAKRRVGNAALAEDVTQAVFVVLAAKARDIRVGTSLPLWLYKATRYASANAKKMERRRQRHERQAASERPTMEENSHAAFEKNQSLLPMLDQAIDRLGDRDRAAVLLRFFEGLSYQQLGQSLGSSPHAAEVRVSRAVEKLRRFFQSKGAAIPTVAVAATLAARVTDAAPPFVAEKVTATALGNSGIGQAVALAGATSKSMAAVTSFGSWAAAAVLLLGFTTAAAIMLFESDGSSGASPAKGPIAANSPPASQPLAKDENRSVTLAEVVRAAKANYSNIHTMDISYLLTQQPGKGSPPDLIPWMRRRLIQDFATGRYHEETTRFASESKRIITETDAFDGKIKTDLMMPQKTAYFKEMPVSDDANENAVLNWGAMYAPRMGAGGFDFHNVASDLSRCTLRAAPETIDGRSCCVADWFVKGAVAATYWIDLDHGAIRLREIDFLAPDSKWANQTSVSTVLEAHEFKDDTGRAVWFPTKMTSAAPWSSQSIVVDIAATRINPKIDPDLFRVSIPQGTPIWDNTRQKTLYSMPDDLVPRDNEKGGPSTRDPIRRDQ